MATETTNTPRKKSPLEEFLSERTLEVRADLRVLFDTLGGDELLESVIERVQQYAVAGWDESRDPYFNNTKSPHMLGTIRETVAEELEEWISHFISDAHRKFIVRCHARGLSTSEAVGALLQEDKTMSRLAQLDVMGPTKLRRALIPRLAYLKPGTARWPERKYGAIWREAREQHKHDIRDIPLTSPSEQIALLAKHADYINGVLDDGNHSVKDFQSLTDALIKTVEALQKLSPVVQEPTNLSGAQLIGVLERLTLALDTPEQFALTGNTKTLVALLERLTLTLLKASDHKAITSEVESVPIETEADNPT